MSRDPHKLLGVLVSEIDASLTPGQIGWNDELFKEVLKMMCEVRREVTGLCIRREVTVPDRVMSTKARVLAFSFDHFSELSIFGSRC